MAGSILGRSIFWRTNLPQFGCLYAQEIVRSKRFMQHAKKNICQIFEQLFAEGSAVDILLKQKEFSASYEASYDVA